MSCYTLAESTEASTCQNGENSIAARMVILWFLGREPQTGHAFVIHQPNAPSGGRLSPIEVGDFLRDGKGPEQQALLRLIGTLVEVPPYADRP